MIELTIEQINRLYNIAYNSGHNDTVEGCSVPADHRDMDEYRRDEVVEVVELIAEMVGDG